MAKTLAQKIEAAKLRKEQEENLISNLLKQQKEEERKERNHRLCKRGGFMEKLLPDLALLTDEQFETFFKKTTANNYGRKALAELVPTAPIQPASSDGDTDTAQSGESGTAQSPATPQTTATSGNTKTADATGVVS